MRIPRIIRADGERWKVLKKDNGLESDYLGRTFPHCHEIILNTDAEGIDATFLHELGHVVNNNRALKLTEEQISSFTSGLYAVIVDNKLDFRNSTKAKKNNR